MATSVELDTSFEPQNRMYLDACCKPAYRVRWLKNRGAILIILWNLLVMSIYHLFIQGYKQGQLNNPFNVNWTGLLIWCMALLFPIGGWLADTRVGRYKVIHYSMWIMWTGMVLATLGELLLANVGANCPKYVKSGIYLSLYSFTAIGFGGFLSNIIHLGVDQLIDASASEITSFISWYTLTFYASGTTLHFVTDCVTDKDTFYIEVFFVAVCLTIVLCLDSLFHHILVNEPVVHGKSLRVIMGVIRYTIRNRYLRYNLTATCTTNNVTPSRFDVAKHMHGGPFTSQQVDNVRTFLWVLAIIATCSLVFGSMEPLHLVQEKIEHHWIQEERGADTRLCYKNLTLRYSQQFIVIAFTILYEFVIHPLFHKCLPRVRITTRCLLAIATFFLWILSLLATDIAIYHQQKSSNTTEVLPICILVDKANITISYKLLLIPSFLDALSQFLLVSSGLEYIWAQTPSTMKGLMLGFAYMFIGLSTLAHAAILSPFFYKQFTKRIPWEYSPLQCEIWYFILEGVIILAVLTVTTVLVKKHNKQKQRSTYFDPYASRE